MAIDCVLGHHMNPLTCGIAKFNTMLAARYGVPFLNVFDPRARRCSRPLVSIRAAEFTPEELGRFEGWLDEVPAATALDLFLHGFNGFPVEDRLLARASMVCCANREIYDRIASAGADVRSLWCPGMNLHPVQFKETELTVLSFGMAHKIRADKYLQLKRLLDATGKTYSLHLSTALHEGTRFEASFSGAYEEMSAIFGDRLFFLGYLSDQAVYNFLRRSTYFAAFFDKGLRSNNTSVNAALQASSVVITNLDERSPKGLEHMKNLIDIGRCDRLPTEPAELRAIGREAERMGNGPLGWDALLEAMSSAGGPAPLGTPSVLATETA